MVLEVTLLFTRSSSALVIFNVMVLPLMAQVPRNRAGDALGECVADEPLGAQLRDEAAVPAEGN